MKNEIESKLKKIIAEQFDVETSEISRDTSFVNDLNADSLDVVEISMEFEDTFEISIPDEQVDKIRTVGDAADYIEQQLIARQTASTAKNE
ncbi:MAG: acyl carrier protein [Planctomycetes bacterium]|nr:acyl carrier protein [Planctomycetota bacterium]